jgi:hypothetical protein
MSFDNTMVFGAGGSGRTCLVAEGWWDAPAATGATHLWYWNLLTGEPVSLPNGATFSFSAGQLVIARCP